MFKVFWMNLRRAAAVRGLFDTARRDGDPLAHPALRAMSAGELADLPFPRPGGRR